MHVPPLVGVAVKVEPCAEALASRSVEPTRKLPPVAVVTTCEHDAEVVMCTWSRSHCAVWPAVPLVQYAMTCGSVPNDNKQEQARQLEEDMRRRQSLNDFASYAMKGGR